MRRRELVFAMNLSAMQAYLLISLYPNAIVDDLKHALQRYERIILKVMEDGIELNPFKDGEGTSQHIHTSFLKPREELLTSIRLNSKEANRLYQFSISSLSQDSNKKLDLNL